MEVLLVMVEEDLVGEVEAPAASAEEVGEMGVDMISRDHTAALRLA